MKNKNLVVVPLFIFVLFLGAHYFSLQLDAASKEKKSVTLGELEGLVKRGAKKYQSPEAFHLQRVEGGNSNIGTRRKNCELDEDSYLVLERSLLLSLKKALLSRFGLEGFQQLFVQNAEIFAMPDVRREEPLLVSGISLQKWDTSKSRQSGSSLKGLAEYLRGFSEVSHVTLETLKVKIAPEWRSSSLSFDRAELTVRFDLRGFTKEGLRQEDRGVFLVGVTKVGLSWKIGSMRALAGETLTSGRKPYFDNVTEKLGLSSVPVLKRTEAIRRGGYAIGIHRDLTDKRIRLIVGSRDKATFWEQKDKGPFVKVNDTATEQTLIKAVALADFFNMGGVPSILVSRFSPDETGNSDLLLMKKVRSSPKYQLVADPIKDRWRSAYAMPLAVGDFNADGYLDFYVGFPGNRDFTASAAGVAVSGMAIEGVFINDRKGGFIDRTKALLASDFSGSQKLFPHSVVSADLNDDGFTDLVVMDDRGNLSPVYLNKGDGSFRQVADEVGLSNRALGMSVAVGDIDNDGLQDLAMTNVDFVAAERINVSCANNWGVFDYVRSMRGRGLRLFKNLGSGHFADISSKAGLSWAGEATAGVEFFDYDSDGFLDLIVSNGLWSSDVKDGSNDLSSLFVQFLGNGGLSFKLRDFTENLARSDFMNVLQEHKGDVLNSVLPKAYPRISGRPSLGGGQKKRLFRNMGNGSFLELGFFEGIDTVADGYSVGVADLSGSSDPDLVFRHADPGIDEITFPSVEVYENTQTSNKALILRFSGNVEKGSNADAIGTKVVVQSGDKTMTKLLIANNGPVQSEHFLHFGLGKELQADTVTIRWPSGKVKVMRDVKAGSHHISE